MKRPGSRLTLRMRLWLVGVLVVGSSLAASLAFTHLSFVLSDNIDYGGAMAAAAIIPLVVAPVAYGWIAILTARLERAREALDELARRDALTGLYNRRAFVELARAGLAKGTAYDLLVADVDHFKRINDSMGHAAGDMALTHMAAVLLAEAPAGAVVARIGGEEFALLLPVAADGAASALVARIAARLAHMPVLEKAGLGRLTCSFGLARAAPGEELDPLLVRADRALYEAKARGRDQLALAG